MSLFFRNLGNAFLNRVVKLLVKIQLFMQMRLGFLKTYAPNAFLSRENILNDDRASYARLDAINGFLPKDAQLTTLDIGCNLGFFTFNMAKRGGFSIGIDYGRNEIMAAKALALRYSVNNVVFTQLEITPENASLLPKVDMVICLSVFHHWIRKLGQEQSRIIMQGLADSSNKYLIFDTGQPNEKNVEWATSLEFMNPDINNWADGYLKSLGFNKVDNIGIFQTSLSEVKRNLYIASK